MVMRGPQRAMVQVCASTSDSLAAYELYIRVPQTEYLMDPFCRPCEDEGWIGCGETWTS